MLNDESTIMAMANQNSNNDFRDFNTIIHPNEVDIQISGSLDDDDYYDEEDDDYNENEPYSNDMSFRGDNNRGE